MPDDRSQMRGRPCGDTAEALRVAIDRMLVDVALSHLGANACGDLPDCYSWLKDKWSVLAELGRLAATGEDGIVNTVAKGLCEIEQTVSFSKRMVRNIRLMSKMRQPRPPAREVFARLERAVLRHRVAPPSSTEVRALLDGLQTTVTATGELEKRG